MLLETQSPVTLKGKQSDWQYVLAYLNLTCHRRYNPAVSGPSGNLTVNGTSTFNASDPALGSLSKRGVGAADDAGIDINVPPYTIHNGK